jgi:hypothetical protein
MRPDAPPCASWRPEAPRGAPMRGPDGARSGPGAVTPNPPVYRPDHVHESKKVIAKRLGKNSVKTVNRLMDRATDPLPVVWCRRRSQWIIVEADLAAWDARQAVPADKAEEMGLVPRRRRAA